MTFYLCIQTTNILKMSKNKALLLKLQTVMDSKLYSFLIKQHKQLFQSFSSLTILSFYQTQLIQWEEITRDLRRCHLTFFGWKKYLSRIYTHSQNTNTHTHTHSLSEGEGAAQHTHYTHTRKLSPSLLVGEGGAWHHISHESQPKKVPYEQRPLLLWPFEPTKKRRS